MLKIGLDIDNTICDTFESLLQVIKKYNYAITAEDYRNNHFDKSLLFNHIDEIQSCAKLKPDVKKYIDLLRQEGNLIYLITFRNSTYTQNYKQVTEDYLKKYDLKVDGIFYNCTDKSIICKQLGINLFIDDKIKNCEAVSKLGTDVLIFDNPYNQNCNFKRVRNFKEIYDYVKKMN